MQFVFFTNSLIPDSGSPNSSDDARFLRGVAGDLIRRRHKVKIFEPTGGRKVTKESVDSCPALECAVYSESTLNPDRVLKTADVVLVQAGASRDLLRRIGGHHAQNTRYRLYFRANQREIADPRNAACDLFHYDAVLAGGKAVRDLYLSSGWTADAVTWHQAVDTTVFRPLNRGRNEGDVVLIDDVLIDDLAPAGNRLDERIDRLREFFIQPVKTLGLKARLYGSGYPAAAIRELRAVGIEYGGSLPHHKVPEVFARYTATIYLPDPRYLTPLAAPPAAVPFEALACGIPMISAPWRDYERLFRPCRDFLFAFDGIEMISQLKNVLSRADLRSALVREGLETILTRHTCAHRAGELLSIAAPRRVAAGRGAFC